MWKFFGNFPQNFRSRKLGEITVFYAVAVVQNLDQIFWVIPKTHNVTLPCFFFCFFVFDKISAKNRPSKFSIEQKEAYLELCQTSKMECFLKIVNGYNQLTIFAKYFILDVWQCSEYASNNEVFFFSRGNVEGQTVWFGINK